MSARVISQAVLGVLALSLLGASVAGFLWGIPAFLLGMAGGTLSLVIVLMWGSLQQMEESDEMEFEQALSYAAPSAEEEQKRALLRTLKDLEYELSVGKISREDYEQVYAEVAEKAKRMIALTDEAMKARLLSAEARVSARFQDQAPAKKKRPAKKSSLSESERGEEKIRAPEEPSVDSRENSSESTAEQQDSIREKEDSSEKEGSSEKENREARS